MCMNIPDAPDIACALRTGYPRPVKEANPIECEYCGKELSGNDDVFCVDGDLICECCFIECLENNHTAKDIAAQFGYRVMTADEAAEKEA